jgi:multidrug resistance efflux pump
MYKFQRKWLLGLILALAVGLVCAPGLATQAPVPTESFAPAASGFSAKGSILPPVPVTVLAPMGGQVQDFTWASGDAVEEGALAFQLTPTAVYAANDGVVASLNAKVGDQAADVAAQYGALCYVQRQDVWRVKASTASAYGDPENRDVHVGQTLRVQHGSGDNKIRGEGRVIQVDGKDFVLEMERGDFEVEDSVSLYLQDSKNNANRDKVGAGKVARADALGAVGEGVVAAVLVTEGQAVERGQPLFLLDSAGARYDAARQAQSEVHFPVSGAIGQMLVGPGQFVQQGQAVATLWPLEALEATLEVDELDIARVRVGDVVRISVDAYQKAYAGEVTQIRPVGQVVLDTTKFLVKVSIENPDALMIGMHVTGYWD